MGGILGIVLATGLRASFGHTNPQKSPLRTTIFWGSNFLKCPFQACVRSFSTFSKFLMALYNDTKTDVYGCYLSILLSPLKNRMPKRFTIAHFGHPVSKSWLIDPHAWYGYFRRNMYTSPGAVSWANHVFTAWVLGRLLCV